MKKYEDASCLVKNNPNIIKELREILPDLQVVFDSDDNDVKSALKANIKELAKSIIRDKKEKEAEENLRLFSDEKGRRLENEIKVLVEEKEILIEEVETLAEENEKLTEEKESLEEEKATLKKYIRNKKSKIT